MVQCPHCNAKYDNQQLYESNCFPVTIGGLTELKHKCLAKFSKYEEGAKNEGFRRLNG